MKILHLTILFVFGIIVIQFASPVFGQISLGGPVQVTHYQFSDMVSTGNNLYVTYQENDDNGGTSHVFFTRSTDAGRSFASPILIDGKTGNSPLMATSGNNVFVSWGTKFGEKEEVFVKKIMDSGTIFGDVVKLTDGKQDYFQEQMISSGNNVYVAIDTAFSGDDLFLAASHDGGNTFENLVSLNHATSIPEFPFAIPVLVVSITSLIVFYRIKFR